MKRIRTYDIADIIWDRHKEEIKEMWAENTPHECFGEFRFMVKDVLKEKYPKQKFSAIFIGYASHYLFAWCVRLYGRRDL